MNHETCTVKLDAYLDGELESAEAQELDRHLRECSTCAAEALRRMQWKRAIKSAGERYAGRAGVSAQSLRPSSAGWTLLSAPRWWPALAGAMAIVVLMAGITINRERGREIRSNQILGELADLHVSTLASASPVDVVSTDRHTVKPWFAGKIPFTFDLPDLQGTPFELVGGRVSYLEQSPGAELLFRVRKHQVSVFIFQEKAVPRGFPATARLDARSFHLDTFERGGLRYFVIGDVATEDIQALAQRM